MLPRAIAYSGQAAGGILCVHRCPGAGKWVEKDQFSRESYERRTAVRNSQLQSLGWNTSAKISFSFSENEMVNKRLLVLHESHVTTSDIL
jgi:hypothetical protein